MKNLLLIIFTPFLLFFCGTASAALYTVDFTASGFTDYFTTWEVPQDSVSGSIAYDVVGGSIDSVYAIDLTINDYSYSVNDILFTSGSYVKFYTDPNGEALNNTSYNDLFIEFKYILPNASGDLLPYAGLYQMHYTVDGGGTRIGDTDPILSDRGWYYTMNGTATVREYQANPVPVPTTLLLLSSGILGLAGVSRKKK